MGSPPPRSSNPNPEPVAGTLDEQTSTSDTTEKTPMGPPPTPLPPQPELRNDAPTEPSSLPDDIAETSSSRPPQPELRNDAPTEPSSVRDDVAEKSSSRPPQRPAVPYTIPPWSGAPCHHFGFEVLKDGSIIDRFDVYDKGAYMFGRVDLCDFILDHPTISRFHAVVQYKRSGEAFLYDLESPHGTFINKKQVEKKTYVDLHVGDVIRFGQSSRLYIFQGPTDLMPPEINLKIKRETKIRESLLDREASLQRARQEASLADGISWGMGEDAIEEAEDDVDEVTWQTYTGQLIERQEKTREKVIKRLEKITHMKKEIDAIRAKDISQGGLTQGQQTQIARNEQRIAQIMEELENLEETLNDSIRESLGARGKLSTGKKKGVIEDEDDYLSDDDEFYDRTKKKPLVKKGAQNQSVETADSLLDKRDTIMKEIEDKQELLSTEKSQMASKNVETPESGDALDAFMSDISSQLVIDKTMQLEEELSALQTELDRISYLLKIADPTGESAKKRAQKVQELVPNKSISPAVSIKKPAPKAPNQSSEPEKPANGLTEKKETPDATTKEDKKSDDTEAVNVTTKSKPVVYVPTKPQWLGAVDSRETEESQPAVPMVQDADDFVDYKDRDKMGDGDNSRAKVDTGIENAAPGLIIRKRKQVHEPRGNKSDAQQESASSTASAEHMAMDAVALLLKHQRVHSISEEDGSEKQETRDDHKAKKDKKPKRVLGPEKPSFLDGAPDYETWVPPEGQSGDGRTSLNDRYGY